MNIFASSDIPFSLNHIEIALIHFFKTDKNEIKTIEGLS